MTAVRVIGIYQSLPDGSVVPIGGDPTPDPPLPLPARVRMVGPLQLITSAGPALDVTAPSTPGNVAVAVAATRANLTWNPSSDDVAVAGYYVYRSASASFTPSSTNRIANTVGAGTGFSDVPGAGTWRYRVSAYDAAGNESPASAVVTATGVQGGTTSGGGGGPYVLGADSVADLTVSHDRRRRNLSCYAATGVLDMPHQFPSFPVEHYADTTGTAEAGSATDSKDWHDKQVGAKRVDGQTTATPASPELANYTLMGGLLRDISMRRPDYRRGVKRAGFGNGPGTQGSVDNLKQQMLDSIEMGCDGWFVEMFSSTAGDQQYIRSIVNVYKARDQLEVEQPGIYFLLGPQPDFSTGQWVANPTLAAQVLAPLLKKSYTFRYQGKRMVVPYYAEKVSVAWNDTFMAELARQGVTDAAMGGLFQNASWDSDAGFGKYWATGDWLIAAQWGDADVTSVMSTGTRMRGGQARANQLYPGAAFMMTLHVQDYRPNGNKFQESRGLDSMRESFLSWLVSPSQLAVTATYDDHSEHSGIAPSEMHGYAVGDFGKYYREAKRNGGVYPRIVRDNLFLSHRLSTAVPPSSVNSDGTLPAGVTRPNVEFPGQTKFTVRYNSTPFSDQIVAYADAHDVQVGDAEVRIFSNTALDRSGTDRRLYTGTATAGQRTRHQTTITTGYIRVELWRGTQIVKRYSSPFPIGTKPWTENEHYAIGSANRQELGQQPARGL